ncbi:hypothetical protein TNCV_4892251 [Trichonephila clavipes]|nr:hypothetical protein TNCV_4892251 [Trichonephila clavipes]
MLIKDILRNGPTGPEPRSHWGPRFVHDLNTFNNQILFPVVFSEKLEILDNMTTDYTCDDCCPPTQA